MHCHDAPDINTFVVFARKLAWGGQPTYRFHQRKQLGHLFIAEAFVSGAIQLQATGEPINRRRGVDSSGCNGRQRYIHALRAWRAAPAEWGNVPIWHWSLLLSLAVAVWYTPHVILFLLVLALESQAVGGSRVYLLIGVRGHLVRALRVLTGQAVTWLLVVPPSSSSTVMGMVMLVWTCVSVACVANLLKGLAARLISQGMHTPSYVRRMQQAVRKEQLLVTLSRPHPQLAAAAAAAGPQQAPLRPWAAAAAMLGNGGRRAPEGAASAGASAGHPVKAGTLSVETMVSHSPTPGDAPQSAPSHIKPMAVPEAEAASWNPAQTHQVGRTRKVEAEADSHSSPGHVPDKGDSETSALLSGVGRSSAASAFARTEFQHTDGWAQSAQLAGAGQLAPARSEPPFGLWHRLQHSWRLAAARDLQQLDQERQRSASLASLAAPAPPPTPQDPTTRPPPAAHVGSPPLMPEASPLQSPVHLQQGPPQELQHGRDLQAQQAGACRPAGAGGAASEGGRAWAPTLQQRLAGAGHALGSTAAASQHGSMGGVSQRREQGMAGAPAAGMQGAAPAPPPASSEEEFYRLERHLRGSTLRFSVTEVLDAAGEEGGSEADTAESAAQLGRYLHWNLRGREVGRTTISEPDLHPFFESPDKAKEAWQLLGGPNAPAAISEPMLVDLVLAIHKERQKLALTLTDAHSVVGKLELICGVVLHAVAAGLYLTILGVDIAHLWVTISSVVIAFAFVFGNSIRNVYEAVIFLFVVHPFDVGDVLQLANGELVKVEAIALQFMTFVKPDGHRVYYPNVKLVQEPCVNLSRSDPFFDSVTLLVDARIPGTLLPDLEAAMRAVAVAAPSDFTGRVVALARGMDQGNKLQLLLRWEYTHTGEEVSHTGMCRSVMLTACTAAMHQAGIVFSTPAQVVFGVNVPTELWGSARHPQDLQGLVAAAAAAPPARKP